MLLTLTVLAVLVLTGTGLALASERRRERRAARWLAERAERERAARVAMGEHPFRVYDQRGTVDRRRPR